MLGRNHKIYIDLLKFPPLTTLRGVKNNHDLGNQNNVNPIAAPEKQAIIEEEVQEELAKSESKNQEKLNVLLSQTETVLLKVGNIIPILKSEIIIDTAKITIIHRPFFLSESIHTITVKNLTSVNIEAVPFLATINLKDVNFAQNNFRVRWIPKGKAEKARRIMTGLMQAAKEGIDLKTLNDGDLAEKVEEIGKVRETQTSVSNA